MHSDSFAINMRHLGCWEESLLNNDGDSNENLT